MSDPSSFLPDNDFVELLWENGPIVMQGQSNRQKKTSYIPSYNQKIQEERDSRDQEITKIGQFNAMESHFAPSVPCANMGLSTQDDDIRMNPWMSYSFEDPLSSEFFSELTGVERNSRSNLDNGNSSKINPVDNNDNKFLKMEHGQFQKYDAASNSKPLHANNGSGLTNFAHFSRPLSHVKVTNESLDRCKVKEKEKAKGEMKAICHQDVSTNKCLNDKITNGALGENQVNVHSSSYGAEKSLEPIVGSSSVCSGNSVGAASNDLKTIEKRKSRGDESEYQSEDIDDESTGLKKSTTGKGGTSAKRSRAAEVHNLSERRRRDRINEKMRALQELIPNCNKADKASMLDEAIEYLKTLQLQVQMMAMGSGLCMSPMMLAPGMQHMRPPTMAHFSHIGVGMGMGMGMNYPMGMLDMNGIPISPMHTSQFPGFGISGHGKGMPVPLPQPSLFNPLSSLLPRGNLANEVPLHVPDLGTSLRFNGQGQQQQQQCVNLEATPKANNIESQADIGHISNGRNSTSNAGHSVGNAEKIE